MLSRACIKVDWYISGKRLMIHLYKWKRVDQRQNWVGTYTYRFYLFTWSFIYSLRYIYAHLPIHLTTLLYSWSFILILSFTPDHSSPTQLYSWPFIPPLSFSSGHASPTQLYTWPFISPIRCTPDHSSPQSDVYLTIHPPTQLTLLYAWPFIPPHSWLCCTPDQSSPTQL